MNREGLAKEFNVLPWKIDEWLLLGCPARKNRKGWDFDIVSVRSWLRNEKIKTKHSGPRRSQARPAAVDQRWFGGRCPVCADKGFLGEKAGKVYTLGEVSNGKWHLRRTGIPCGHSVCLTPRHY